MCAFWEDVFEHLLPTGGLREWGASLFVELTRAVPHPELDPRTTAKRECARLFHEIELLKRAVNSLAIIRGGAELMRRAEKLKRTAQLCDNIIDELLILHNSESGPGELVEAEQDGILNYQIYRF